MPFLMSFALEHEIVTLAWIDNASVQFPLNIYATKGFISVETPRCYSPARASALHRECKREAGFESQSEDITLGLFTRTGRPNGFRPCSNHLSSDITTVVQSALGRVLRASGLASDSVFGSKYQERSNSFVPLGQRGHLL